MLLTAAQARQAYEHAGRHRYALLAINADSHAAITDGLEAALLIDAPVIIETSLWQLRGRSFGNGDAEVGMAAYLAHVAVVAASPRYHKVPVIFHTDHIKGPETLPLLRKAIEGFPVASGCLTPSSFSLDSSEMTAEENIRSISALAGHADQLGQRITLEMEAGVDDGITPMDITDQLLTGVEQQRPGHLALYAPGAGTRHGYSANGFPDFSPKSLAEHQRRASSICGRPIGIALHGSSGLSDQQLADAVGAGVVKINWSSDSLAARSEASLAFWKSSETKLARDHKDFKVTAMDNGVQEAIARTYVAIVAERIRVLGGADQAQSLRQKIAPTCVGAQA